MGKLPPRHIKLTLKPKYHADVIAIIDRIEPGKLAATVIQLLRLYPQLVSQTAQFSMAAAVVIAPTEESVIPTVPTQKPTRSRVSLSAGFDVLDE